MTLTPAGAFLSVMSPQGGGGSSWNFVGRRANNQATGSCPISRRYSMSGSATGSTAEMTTMRQPLGFRRRPRLDPTHATPQVRLARMKSKQEKKVAEEMGPFLEEGEEVAPS